MARTSRARAGPAALEGAWARATERWLPDGPTTSIWRANRAPRPDDVDQGWKLHVSATILSATPLIERLGPLLQASSVLYKLPVTLLELKRLNCGLFYGYAQIGKCITIYPRSPREASEIAALVHTAGRGLPGPVVPFEHPCFAGSIVHRRYGSFETLVLDDDARTPAIRAPNGDLVHDRRDENPPWSSPDPFSWRAGGIRRRRKRATRLSSVFRAYEALSQRGKGGVYRAIDVRSGIRPCILKEGRRHGEVDWDGTDGRARVEHEGVVGRSLYEHGVPVPEVYASFREGREGYLVLEAIDGPTLQRSAVSSSTKLPMAAALDLGHQCARLLAQIHRAGWIWRDCKPANLMVENGKLRPLDFEGAVVIGSSDALPWGTAGYLPPEWLDDEHADGPVSLAQDLYALGALLHAIFSGLPPPAQTPPRPVGVHRRGVPRAVRTLIASLLDDDPQRRPSAASAARALARVT